MLHMVFLKKLMSGGHASSYGILILIIIMNKQTSMGELYTSTCIQ